MRFVCGGFNGELCSRVLSTELSLPFQWRGCVCCLLRFRACLPRGVIASLRVLFSLRRLFLFRVCSLFNSGACLGVLFPTSTIICVGLCGFLLAAPFCVFRFPSRRMGWPPCRVLCCGCFRRVSLLSLGGISSIVFPTPMLFCSCRPRATPVFQVSWLQPSARPLRLGTVWYRLVGPRRWPTLRPRALLRCDHFRGGGRLLR